MYAVTYKQKGRTYLLRYACTEEHAKEIIHGMTTSEEYRKKAYKEMGMFHNLEGIGDFDYCEEEYRPNMFE